MGFLKTFSYSLTINESYYLKLEKYLCSIFVCFCNIWRLYEEKNIWYDMILLVAPTHSVSVI